MSLPVRFHSSVVIPFSEKSGRIILGRYDTGYPFPLYHNSYNPLGGNPTLSEKTDGKGPLTTLVRELKEEVNPEAIYSSNPEWKNAIWAQEREIEDLQQELINNLTPFRDLYVHAPTVEGGRQEHNFIYSVFESRISDSIIDQVERNIREGKKIVTEGYIGIAQLDDLESGKSKLAHSSALIFREMFSRNFPCPIPGANALPLGFPKQKYIDYTTIDYDPRVFKE